MSKANENDKISGEIVGEGDLWVIGPMDFGADNRFASLGHNALTVAQIDAKKTIAFDVD